MSLAKKKVMQALGKKGFREERKGDHIRYFFVTSDGREKPVQTKVSHGSKSKELGDDLISKMAGQCGLTRLKFEQLIDCTLTKEKYERKLRKKGYI